MFDGNRNKGGVNRTLILKDIAFSCNPSFLVCAKLPPARFKFNPYKRSICTEKRMDGCIRMKVIKGKSRE